MGRPRLIDPRFIRPAEVDLLIGNPTKALEKLGWKLEVAFEDLVTMMVDSDMTLIAATARSGPSPS